MSKQNSNENVTMSLVFQTGWYSDYYCHGNPDTIIVFNETNPTPEYESASFFNYIPNCGSDIYSVDIGCCLSSLDLIDTNGYTSFSRNYYGEYDFVQSTPLGTRGTYCLLQNITQYEQVYLLQNSKCLEDVYKCTETGVLVYPTEGCQGSPQALSFGGNATLYTISSGQMTIEWTAFEPPTLLIPNYSEPLEILQLIFFIVTILGFVWLISFQILNFCKRKRRVDLLQLVYSFLLLIKLIYTFYYDYNIFTNDEWLATATFILALFDLTSLFICFVSCRLLFEIFKFTRIYQVISIVLVVLIHLGLEVPTYCSYATLVTSVPACSSPDLFVISIPLRDTWIIFSVILEILPPGIIFFMIMRQLYLNKKRQYRSTTVFTIFFLQVLGVLINFLMNFIGPKLARTDRQNLALSGMADCSLVFNSILVISLYQELTRLTRKILTPQTEMQSAKKKVMLLDLIRNDQSSEADMKKTFQDGTIIINK
ncbi:hypothetical protein HDV01_006685 [Terramyces sp. JEL0728]|nr:hypothetical protein HDV01_006685 [Terramyces sp. JEL0728]